LAHGERFNLFANIVLELRRTCQRIALSIAKLPEHLQRRYTGLDGNCGRPLVWTDTLNAGMKISEHLLF
jgi:hypothetical protein